METNLGPRATGPEQQRRMRIALLILPQKQAFNLVMENGNGCSCTEQLGLPGWSPVLIFNNGEWKIEINGEWRMDS